ncbi:hypothetical protein MHYP_G00147340 [Metynnis hypsauchen]
MKVKEGEFVLYDGDMQRLRQQVCFAARCAALDLSLRRRLREDGSAAVVQGRLAVLDTRCSSTAALRRPQTQETRPALLLYPNEPPNVA